MYGELLTRQEAAARLRVSVQTLARMLAAGQPESFRLGRLVRIPAASVADFLARTAGPERQGGEGPPGARPGPEGA